MAARSSSSRRWLARQRQDPYVKRAHAEGYRSRAAFKLLEIQERDRLLKPGMVVVDLGAAPGGWSQVAARLVGDRGKVVATDILPMDPVAGVTFVQGDFREIPLLDALMALLGETPVGLVISDMAPNTSGVRSVDQPRSMYLAELALEFAGRTLKPDGDMIVKVFQGEGFEAFVRAMRTVFGKVALRKPDASRSESREMYVVARGFKPQ